MNAVEFIPSGPVVAALLALAMVPLGLFLLGLERCRIPSAGKRYLVCSSVALLLWGSWLIGSTSRSPGLLPMEWSAGLLILLAGLIAGWVGWSLLAYGFTLSLLEALREFDRPISVETWTQQLGGGTGLDGLFQGRLALLLKSRVLARNSEVLTLTSVRGKTLARLVALVRGYFGGR